MKFAIIFACITSLLAVPVSAQHLGTQRPLKPDSPVLKRQVVHDRQGGDTIAEATVIDGIPFADSGTTAGYNDDYDEVCPYDNSTSPDVVYSFFNYGTHVVDIDLCGSTYDTKLYVYDDAMNLVACNDDYYFDSFCGLYVSALFSLSLSTGTQYYIVIDGYGGDFGDYEIQIHEIYADPCTDYCLDGYEEENEPELMDDYEDAYNGGCNSPEFGNPFQELWGEDDTGSLNFCGLSGWYAYGEYTYRDTDWFTAIIGDNGTIEWYCYTEYAINMFQLGPLNCDEVGVLQSATAACWDPALLTVVGEPGEIVWLWIGPTVFDPPPGMEGHEFEYLMSLSGLQAGPVATDSVTWSALKMLYR